MEAFFAVAGGEGGGDEGVGGEGGEGRGGEGEGVVADGVVTDKPGVHVGAGGLEENAFGGLKKGLG